MTFLALNYGTSDISLWSIVDKYRENMYGRISFIYLYMYQIGQGCEYTRDKNSFEDLTSISITPVYPGGYEAFVNKRNSIIMNME